MVPNSTSPQGIESTGHPTEWTSHSSTSRNSGSSTTKEKTSRLFSSINYLPPLSFKSKSLRLSQYNNYAHQWMCIKQCSLSFLFLTFMLVLFFAASILFNLFILCFFCLIRKLKFTLLLNYKEKVFLMIVQ